MSVDELAKRIVTNAGELLAAGWCQKKHQITDANGNTSYCIRGAVLESADRIIPGQAGPDDRSYKAYYLANKAIRSRIKSTTEFSQLTFYNDHVGRTQEEVVSLVRSVAESM